MEERNVSDRRVDGQKPEAHDRAELLSLIPGPPGWQIDWGALFVSAPGHMFMKMSQTDQNPQWHGEGDVWTHTRMVCEELAAMSAFRELPSRQRQEVFLAALLHDIGKIPCTKLEDGRLVSPNHTVVGARMAREFLRVVCGLSGTRERLAFRETVCALVRYHSVPVHILDQTDPERRLFGIAADGELAEDFTIRLLCILAEADIRGRICERMEESVETVRLCAELAKEQSCLDGPYPFASSYTERAYLSGRQIRPEQELYDDTWGEVLLLSGLPGTGKDTWIREHAGSLPMVSLDEIRRELRISPKEHQGPVAAAARERAREYLRQKTPFVWNATNLTPSIREKLVRLFQDYHASVRIIYLETGWEEELRRNQNRRDAVPEDVIEKMMKNLELPRRYEAERVEWICV